MKKLDNIDWSGVIATAESIIKEVENGEYHEENDNNQYIYEAVMTAIYGDDVWKIF